MATVERTKVEEQPRAMIEQLVDIAVLSFGKILEKAIRERFEKADALYILKADQKVVGYGLNDHLELEGLLVNYYSSGFIHPEYQKHGLYHLLNMERAKAIEADALMTRTQNPQVYSGFARLCEQRGYTTYPTAEDREIPDKRLALAIARAYEECTEEMVCPGAYGIQLIRDRQPAPNGLIAPVFYDINIQRGDAVMLVGLK